jgi:hypothetical protein
MRFVYEVSAQVQECSAVVKCYKTGSVHISVKLESPLTNLCIGKAMSVTYYECVSVCVSICVCACACERARACVCVALVIQHAVRMRRCYLWPALL